MVSHSVDILACNTADYAQVQLISLTIARLNRSRAGVSNVTPVVNDSKWPICWPRKKERANNSKRGDRKK